MTEVSRQQPRLDWRSDVESTDVEVPVGASILGGRLFAPVTGGARALLTISHVSAIKHLASGECFVAGLFARAGLMTLLLDLLTEDEATAAPWGSDEVPRLAERLVMASRWLLARAGPRPLFHLAAGAAAPAALLAGALDQEPRIAAIVGHGRQVERAGAAAVTSTTPVLWLLGQLDDEPPSPRSRSMLIARLGTDLGSEEGRDRIALASLAWFDRWLKATPGAPAERQRPDEQSRGALQPE